MSIIAPTLYAALRLTRRPYGQRFLLTIIKLKIAPAATNARSSPLTRQCLLESHCRVDRWPAAHIDRRQTMHRACCCRYLVCHHMMWLADTHRGQVDVSIVVAALFDLCVGRVPEVHDIKCGKSVQKNYWHRLLVVRWESLQQTTAVKKPKNNKKRNQPPKPSWVCLCLFFLVSPSLVALDWDLSLLVSPSLVALDGLCPFFSL